jgi:hypothetical protein
MKRKTKALFLSLGGRLRYQWKWAYLIGYTILCLFVWYNRYSLLNPIHIAPNNFFYSVYRITIDVLYLFLASLCFFTLLKAVKGSVFLNWWLQRKFRRIDFSNSLGELPVLLSRCRDINTKHGIIYVFKNRGISLIEFDGKIHQLEAAMNRVIYRIDYGRSTRRTLLYLMPRKFDVPKVISLDDDFLCAEPNLLCVGKTGTGKSYALATLLGKYALHIPGVSITICDFKKSSFAQFEGTPNFFGYENVPDGIQTFYKEFCERLAANDEQRNKQVRVLLIDEYGALISAQDKKEADALKSMVGEMLFMGRSLGLRVVIGVQSAYSELFRAGARDQFRAIIALGNLSKEQKQMLFSDYKEEMTAVNGVGEGYLLIEGQNVERTKIAPISDFDKLNDSIKNTMYL